jgi:hypothetical protein
MDTHSRSTTHHTSTTEHLEDDIVLDLKPLFKLWTLRWSLPGFVFHAKILPQMEVHYNG